MNLEKNDDLKEVVDKMDLPDINGRRLYKSFVMTDGRVAKTHRGKGYDVPEIQKAMGDDASKYLLAAMHVLVTIDGERVAMEDLEQLDLSDFGKIMIDVTEVTGNG